MRGEISYVWGYHEWGFWGAFNAGKGLGIVSGPLNSHLKITQFIPTTPFIEFNLVMRTNGRSGVGPRMKGKVTLGRYFEPQ